MNINGPKPKANLKRRPKRPQAGTVTGTAELVLAPQIRRFAARLYIGAAVVVVFLAVAALGAVRYLAVVEPMLASEGANAVRAIVSELPAGAELHIPIEPHSDLLRFLVDAYGGADMALTPHAAQIQLTVRGTGRTRAEEIRADLPGLRSRVTAENASVGVGDPLAFEVDVHDAGVGEVVVKLVGIAGADGLFVRTYRREQLGDSEVRLREAALDRVKKDELAKWTWELGWDELTAPERGALLQARWRRIGAVRGASADLRSTTIAIAPPPPHALPPSHEELLGRVALRGDERVVMLVHPGVRVRFQSDEATALSASSRDAANVIESKSAQGQIEVGPFSDVRSVEVGATRDVLIEVRTDNAAEVEWPGWSNMWRITPARPVVIDSPEADRVVRVSLRRPMARTDTSYARLGVAVELSGGGLAAPITAHFSTDRARSRVDRYQDFDAPDAPSERAMFYLSLPRGARARISPADNTPLDLSLSELDPAAPPPPMPVRAPDAPRPVIAAETEDARGPFVPRRPSNAFAFDETARKVVRTAHWFAPAPAPPPQNTIALAHAKRIVAEKVERNGRTFEGVARPFDLEADPRRPLFLPIVAAFDATTVLTVTVERDPPARVLPGLFTRWTLPRTMAVGPDDKRATFIIGDDVPTGGKLRLHIIADDKSKATNGHPLVMLPWMATTTASTRTAGPRWLSGAFEE